VRQARRQSIPDPLDPYPNDRYCAGDRADRLRNGVGTDNDHLGLPGDDLAREVGITRGPPAAGIPLDGEVLSLDIAQPAQLGEKCPKDVTSVDQSDRT
jgi:hypothetical protein